MFRQALVNLVTIALTVGVLVLIAVVNLAGAWQDRPEPAAASPPATTAPPSVESTASPSFEPTALPPAPSLSRYKRVIGVAADPWHVDEWDTAVSARFDIAMNFYAWSKQRDPSEALAEAARRGVIPMITWEPWKPKPTSAGAYEQGVVQERFSNAAIAAGRWDAYLQRFARAVAAQRGPVMLRYAHEMNGYWYPWHHDAAGYVRAWRHVVSLFRREGARNAVFVWSVNPSLYITDDDAWMEQIKPYWPGARYVDWVGSTMINFGGTKEHAVAEYGRRIEFLRTFGKPIVLTEVNVHFAGRKQFLRDLRGFLATSPWVRGLIWSQFPSRGQATLNSTIPVGEMNWQASADRFSSRVLGAIIREAHRASPGPATTRAAVRERS